MRQILILAIIGLTSGTASALAGEESWNDLMRGSGVVVDHQPLNTGGLGSDTELIDMFGNPAWQRVADDFQLSAAEPIGSIRWWGFYNLDNPPASEMFRIRVYGARASDGLPDEGNIVFQEQVNDPSRVYTGRQIATGVGPKEYLYTFELPTAVQIVGDTKHWLEIIQLGDLSTAFRWEFSVAENNGQAFINAATVDWRLTSTSGFNADTAYQLIAVPEPATSTLICIGSGAICLHVRSGRNSRGQQ